MVLLSFIDFIKKYHYDIKKEEIVDLLKKFNTLKDNLTNDIKNSKTKEVIHAILQNNTITIEENLKYYKFLFCIYEQEKLLEIDREIRELEEKIKAKKAEYDSTLVKLMSISCNVSFNEVPILPYETR